MNFPYSCVKAVKASAVAGVLLLTAVVTICQATPNSLKIATILYYNYKVFGTRYGADVQVNQMINEAVYVSSLASNNCFLQDPALSSINTTNRKNNDFLMLSSYGGHGLMTNATYPMWETNSDLSEYLSTANVNDPKGTCDTLEQIDMSNCPTRWAVSFACAISDTGNLTNMLAGWSVIFFQGIHIICAHYSEHYRLGVDSSSLVADYQTLGYSFWNNWITQNRTPWSAWVTMEKLKNTDGWCPGESVGAVWGKDPSCPCATYIDPGTGYPCSSTLQYQYITWSADDNSAATSGVVWMSSRNTLTGSIRADFLT